MIRKIAIVLLLLVIGYVGWVIALNMPGNDHRPRPQMQTGPAKTITAPDARPVVVPVAAPPGALIIPVAGIRRDQLVDTFDDARSEGRVHDAIDIMAPRGTPVLAASAGTVEKIFESKLGGHTVYIRRDGGAWVDYYAHLDGYAPGTVEGAKVKQGQIIATVGSTGDASAEAPHLHYAVNMMAPGESWHQGKAVNPYPLLMGR